MQFISVYKKDSNTLDVINKKDNVIYRSDHLRNGDFLEREKDGEKFNILRYVDDCSHTTLTEVPEILKLMNDIDVVIRESQIDKEICNHMKEIIFLCKLCIWNRDDFYLELSPWGADINTYPSELPERYRFNISSL